MSLSCLCVSLVVALPADRDHPPVRAHYLAFALVPPYQHPYCFLADYTRRADRLAEHSLSYLAGGAVDRQEDA
jgi:hypothetical protein